MDKKRLVIGMALAMAMIFLWQRWIAYESTYHPDWIQPKHQPDAATPEQTSASSTAPSSLPAGGIAANSAGTMPAMTMSPSSASSPALLTAQGGTPQSVVLGSIQFDPKGEGKFRIGVALNVRGAAVNLAVLNRFRLAVGNDQPYYFEQPYLSGGPMAAALATRWVAIDGVRCDLWNVDWALRSDPKSDTAAIYAVDMLDVSGKKLLTIEKHFEVKNALDKEVQKTGQGYEFDVTYNLINLAGRDMKVRLGFDGPNTPSIENNRDIAELFTAYNDRNTVLTGDPHAILGFKDRNEVDLKDPKGKPFLWTAMRSNYFDAVVRTAQDSGPGVLPPPGHIDRIFAQAQASDPKAGLEKDVAIGIETDDLDVPATGAGASLPLYVYFGPSAREIITSDYYSSYPRSYNLTLVIASGMCSICTFPMLVNALVGLLGIFHFILRDWGLSIIALVLLVRLVLHPITKRSQISMTRMSKMAPEMERLKKKFGDDKEGLNKAMMGFYREQGITPILGCLPMFLQMPIWIALWNALQSTFEIRHAKFLWGLTWIKDLSQEDRLMSFLGHSPTNPFKFGFISFDAVNLLPVLMAVVFFIQQKLQPKPDIKTLSPEQAQQQKMMQWMSLLFPVFLYNSPSGLNLYILTSTTIGIFEAKRIRDHIKERDLAEKEGKVILDGKSPAKGGIGSWLGAKFGELQARAEAIRNEGEQGGKKKTRN